MNLLMLIIKEKKHIMNNNDYTLFFIMMALLNTNIGLNNGTKNKEQVEQNKLILEKIDKILEKLNER